MRLILILFSLFLLMSCNNTTRFFDSEIGAIRDQTEVMKEHNKLVKEQNQLLFQLINKQ